MNITKLTAQAKRWTMALMAVVFVAGIASAMLPTAHAAAAVSQSKATPLISFTFDDGLASTYNIAAPILSADGLTGTDYVISGCVGMTTTPNTCNANSDRSYMTWAQVKALQTTYKWEIGDHTVDHDCLASSAVTDSGDCANAAPLTTAQVDTELSGSMAAMEANGITNITDMAPPYGDYNNNVLAQIAKYYASMRQFKNAADNANVYPYSDYYLQDYTVQEGTTPVSAVETAINSAITNNQWLVLTFHDIAATPSTNADDWQYGTSEFSQIAAYVQSEQAAGKIKSVTVNNGLVTSNINFLNNGNFAQGIADGWTTDNASAVTFDTGDNGSYPNPTDSIKFVSSATAAHLFGPKVQVVSGDTYMFKNFINVAAMTSGEIGFYVDEYDANGNWISGQWKTRENSSFVEDMNFSYTPSSANVKYAALQVYTTANSGITAYLANAQMFDLNGSSPITTSPTTPTGTDIMPNSSFSAGVADGWSTDNATAFAADSGSHGNPSSNPQYSIKLTAPASGTTAHLFSPEVSVASGTSYTIYPWVNLTTLGTSGELGIYVDEYNSTGAWVSGQYLKTINTSGAQQVSVNYTPTSTSVAKASVQYILPGGSGAAGYLASAQFYAPGTVTPPPTETTVLQETFSKGIADGWTDDSAANFTADSAGNGGPSDQYSVKFTAPTTATNVHLFSPKVAVSSANGYTISSYLNLTGITSGQVVGYYIDEYNSAGTWISGQYLKSVSTTGAQTVSLSYKPSSASVATASLQFIVVGNSAAAGYFSNVAWTTP